MWFYCRKIRINHPELTDIKGPALIACNHPNSFLDAIIFSSVFKQPIYSLARGDVFKNKWIDKIFRSLNMFPVYRTSEGVENMERNYTSFDSCIEVFKKGGIVLIFSEGRCINEWHLRPLKKGTARLALSAWTQGVDLTVLPVGINYQSFRRFGKNIDINFGKPFGKNDIKLESGFGKSVMDFNEKLKKALQPLVYEINNEDEGALRRRFEVDISLVKKIVLGLPAVAGFLLHLPLYFLIRYLANKIGSNNDHYDSIAVGGVFLLYPFYLFFLLFLMYGLIGMWAWLIFLIAPASGWCYLMLKRQF